MFTAALMFLAVTWANVVSIRRTPGISHRGIEGVTGSCRHWVWGAKEGGCSSGGVYHLFCCQMDKSEERATTGNSTDHEHLGTARI